MLTLIGIFFLFLIFIVILAISNILLAIASPLLIILGFALIDVMVYKLFFEKK